MRWRKTAVPLPGVPLSVQGVHRVGRGAVGRRAGDRPAASVRGRRGAPGASMAGVGRAAGQLPTVHEGLVAHAETLVAESAPPIVLDIDETSAAGRGGPATRPAPGCGWSGSRPTS